MNLFFVLYREIDNEILDKVVSEGKIKSVAQLSTSVAVGAAVQVFFATPFAIWNGVLGGTKVVAAFIGGHTGAVERQRAQDTLQHGLYMAMVAVIDLIVAAAICTIVIPVGYAIYMALHSGSSMGEQSKGLIGDFVKPIRNDDGVAKASWAQSMAYRGMKIVLP